MSVSDESGNIITQAIYDPWGKRTEIYTASLLSDLKIAPPADRGFTGHKHLEGLNIIHMKGRIYDPTLGRFLQADPFIQAPLNSQSYNRYAYVFNNPLSNIDPSGYISLNPFKKLTRNIIRGVSKVFGKRLVNFVGNAASLGCLGWAPACAAAWNYEFARAHGASSSGALRAGATAAVATYAFQQIGSHYSDIGTYNSMHVNGELLTDFGGNLLTSGQIASQITAHAIVGGVVSSLSGGKFGHGFFSAGVTKGVGGTYLPGGSNLSSSDLIKSTVISAVIGGTASVISGGKFANGASTAVYQYLFNQASNWLQGIKNRHQAARQYKALKYERSRLIAALDSDLDILYSELKSFGYNGKNTYMEMSLAVTSISDDLTIQMYIASQASIKGGVLLPTVSRGSPAADFLSGANVIWPMILSIGYTPSYTYNYECSSLCRLEFFKAE